MALNLCTTSRTVAINLISVIKKEFSYQKCNKFSKLKFHLPISFYAQSFYRQYSQLPRKQPTMRFIQFKRIDDQKTTKLGLLSEDGNQFVDLSAKCPHITNMIGFIKTGPNGLSKITEKLGELVWENLDANVELLPPVTNPEKIVCIGLNYLGHCLEQNKEPPKEPMFFSKFASTLVGANGNVVHHNITNVSVCVCVYMDEHIL